MYRTRNWMTEYGKRKPGNRKKLSGFRFSSPIFYPFSQSQNGTMEMFFFFRFPVYILISRFVFFVSSRLTKENRKTITSFYVFCKTHQVILNSKPICIFHFRIIPIKRNKEHQKLEDMIDLALAVCHFRESMRNPENEFHLFIFRLDAWALSVIATATWLAGWLAGWVAGWVSITLRYCIKTAKPIRTLFRPSESPIILVFWDPCADTKFQGGPHQRGR